jgi:hypothetical protein
MSKGAQLFAAIVMVALWSGSTAQACPAGQYWCWKSNSCTPDAVACGGAGLSTNVATKKKNQRRSQGYPYCPSYQPTTTACTCPFMGSSNICQPGQMCDMGICINMSK